MHQPGCGCLLLLRCAWFVALAAAEIGLYGGNFTDGTSAAPGLSIGADGVQAIQPLRGAQKQQIVLVGGNISWSDVHGLVVYDELSLEWGSYQGLKLSAGSSVYALASTVVDDKTVLFVGGSFVETLTVANGAQTDALESISNFLWHNGENWELDSFNRGFDGTVSALAINSNSTGQPADIYVGGEFEWTFDYTISARFVMRGVYTAVSSGAGFYYSWSSVAADDTEGTTLSLALCGSYLFAGGSFESGVKFVDLNKGNTTNWQVGGEGLAGTVRTLACAPQLTGSDIIHAGGTFTTTNGVLELEMKYLTMATTNLTNGTFWWHQVGKTASQSGRRSEAACASCTGTPLTEAVTSIAVSLVGSELPRYYTMYVASGQSVYKYIVTGTHPHALSPSTEDALDGNVSVVKFVSGASTHAMVSISAVLFSFVMALAPNAV